MTRKVLCALFVVAALAAVSAAVPSLLEGVAYACDPRTGHGCD